MIDSQVSKLTTNQKALKINLDANRYGTFAEIGAGQEVARWFFKVGGAAGTISKSISAYDMAVSDAIYGRCKRYVSCERLLSMLDYEHKLNLERLRDLRGNSTAFFAFADTVSALNFEGTNECHGWMGVRYQVHPRDEDSQILIHVRMLDRENSLQQDALGIVGVNLLYGAFFSRILTTGGKIAPRGFRPKSMFNGLLSSTPSVTTTNEEFANGAMRVKI